MPAVTAILGAVAMLLWVSPDIERMLKVVDWTTLVFFISLFIVVGTTGPTHLDFAESNQCDLIIIGSRGETGAMRWRFGSVSSKVVRAKTTMPVLVVST